MPVINILSPHLADMIAAGEVVERPASVVKELMENAFDAGAKNLTVEIRNGGATYIRVTDDGCGMSPEDAGIAFLRHATSKLHDEKGLEAIGTMGFRGEALAAVSAVSNIEMTTRRRGDDSGTMISLTAGDILDMGPAGCPYGTTMIVRDLFFNTPARLKFLKSDRSEASACQLAALRCALGRPEVSVRFIRDGKEEFFSPGDGRMDSCLYSLLGRDMAANMLSCVSTGEGLSVSGFVSSPSACRGNRSAQYFFCNGRFIKSPLLQTAVEQAYKNSLLSGRFPACVLYLEISSASVDVNVHPAKTEVKFSSEKQVFDLVYHAVRFALEGESRTAEPQVSPATYKAVQAEQNFYRRMSSSEFRSTLGGADYAAGKISAVSASVKGAREDLQMRSAQLDYQSGTSLPTYRESPVFSSKKSEIPSYIDSFPLQNVDKTVQTVENFPVCEHKIIGEILKTYIIVERKDSIVLIDKHAAHERVIFDRLKSLESQIMSQSLLSPIPLHLNGEDSELVELNGELLCQLGFEIEPFGENEFIIRAAPADIASSDIVPALEEICEKLRRGNAPDKNSVRDEILHTLACKAAIKAGWDTHKEELSRLVEAVLSGQVKYCPHGRPVAVTMSRKDLDKMFKRIV